jgi:hypothetical protein
MKVCFSAMKALAEFVEHAIGWRQLPECTRRSRFCLDPFPHDFRHPAARNAHPGIALEA